MVLLERLIDLVVIHIFHDPIGSSLQIVLLFDEGTLGSISSEAHRDQHIYVLLRPLRHTHCSFQLISHGGSRVDEEV